MTLVAELFTVSIQCGKHTNFKSTKTAVQNHMTPTKNINSNIGMKNSTPDIKFLPGKKQPAAGTGTKKNKINVTFVKSFKSLKKTRHVPKNITFKTNGWVVIMAVTIGCMQDVCI